MKIKSKLILWSIVSAACLSSVFASGKQQKSIVTPAFQKSAQAFPFQTTRQIALGDVDGDGDLDAVLANMQFNDSLLWLNDGTGRFTDSGLRLTQQGHGVALGDLNRDGTLDIFFACCAYNEHYLPSKIYFNNGRGQFTDSGQDLGDSTLSGVAIRLLDLDGDKDLDAMVQYSTGQFKIYLNDGNGRFSESSFALSGYPTPGDLNGDGFVDFFIKDIGEEYRTLLNDGKGHFKSRWKLKDPHVRYGDVVLGDVDRDGDIDAIVVNGDSLATYPTKIWLNDGTGRFSGSTQSLPSSIDTSLSIGDLNQDGSPDLVFANNEGPIQIRLNDGKGRFMDRHESLQPDPLIMFPNCLLGDINRDNRLDIVVAAYGAGSNQIWFNMTDIKNELTWLNGSWSGTVYQPKGGTQFFPVTFTVDAPKGIYKIQYPTIPFKAVLSLTSADDCQAMFIETATSGHAAPGTVAITKIIWTQTNSKYITWTRYLDSGALDAWATLKRK